MAVITSSVGGNLGEQFWIPFIHTAQYLGMGYLGGLHTIYEQWNVSMLTNFVSSLNNAKING